MKKILILLILLIIPSGCLNVQNASIEEIVSSVQNSPLELSNQIRTGYRYYLPLGMHVESINLHNEIIVGRGFRFFLYVDFVSYYNNVEFEYEISEASYISKNISFNNTPGYLEVNVKDGKYLIEIMFNYAKIEVIVDRRYLNEAITKALVILSTIRFNNDIVSSMIGNNTLSFGEEELNIFDTNRGESNFLEYLEHDYYEGDDIPDLDRLN